MIRAASFASLILLSAQGYQRAESPSHVFAVGAHGAVLMAPAELVCSSYAHGLLWTDDGAYLVAERLVVSDATPGRALLAARQRENLEGIAALSQRREIVAWNRRHLRSRVLLDYDPAKLTLDSLMPIPGGDRLYARMVEKNVDPNTGAVATRRGYALFNTASGSVARIAIPEPDRPDLLEFSPLGLGALVQSASEGHPATVTMVGADGRLGRTIALPDRAFFAFEDDGTSSVGLMKTDPNGKRTFEFHRVNLAMGTIGPIVERQAARSASGRATLTPKTGKDAPEVEPEISVYEGKVAPEGSGVWLRVLPGDKPENVGLLTTDGSQPLLSPKNDAVAYLSGGSAYVRTLSRLTPEEYALAAADADRERALDRGRHIATALSNYASDSDGALPPLGFDLKKTATPYIRNPNDFDGFAASFGGLLPKEGLSDLKLGSITVPGGQVVVYGDGTVTWVPAG